MAKLWARGKRIWTAFETHQGSLMAAAVAFYGLLSVIPLLSLGVAVVAVVAGSSRLALETLQSITAQLLPGEQELVYNTVRELRHGSGLVGIIGLGGLLISSSAVFTTLDDALNGMWHVPNRRAWWKQKLVAAGTAGELLEDGAAAAALKRCEAIGRTLAALANRLKIAPLAGHRAAHKAGERDEPTQVAPLLGGNVRALR